MSIYYEGRLSNESSRGMSELSDYVRHIKEEKSLTVRELADELKVQKGVVEAAMKQHTASMKLDSLRSLARGLGIPLWRVVQMSGVDLELPQSSDERAQRLANLAQQMPQYQAIVDHLLALDPEDADGILMHLEGIALHR